MKAEILLDSLNPYTGHRLTTFYLVYPQNCHQHILTHRMFSRNAMSLRAISTERASDFDLVFPTWTMEKKGMSGELANEITQDLADVELDRMYRSVLSHCAKLQELGIHHQNINDYLRPFLDIHVILSATDFDNFFDLRLSKDTKPDTRQLVQFMKAAMFDSKPIERLKHIPGEASMFSQGLSEFDLMKVSAAKLARYSYLSWKDNVADDLNLADKLIANKHASPFEHIATASSNDQYYANFNSWIQFRKELGL